ncbi:MAG: hypothetical protein AB1578_14505 [Thermodesulfobacteriota bacterium]
MPDYPYVYAASPARPVQPGGTRVRVLRRGRPAQESAEEEGGEDRGPGGEETWRTLLTQAVDDLNASFRSAGAPFACALEEDAEGLFLRVRRHGDAGAGEDVEDEVLEPQDLPRWLHRIRVGLGLLVDETA